MAPMAWTLWAMAVICPSLSTEQGPAKTASFLPPTFTPGAISTSVSAGWYFRFTFL